VALICGFVVMVVSVREPQTMIRTQIWSCGLRSGDQCQAALDSGKAVPTPAMETCSNADDTDDYLTPTPCDLSRRHCLLYRLSYAQVLSPCF
jgi:hypothetical protein